MRNRFNLNEEEKNRIRGLHKNYSIIKEQINITNPKEARAKIMGCARGAVSNKQWDLIDNFPDGCLVALFEMMIQEGDLDYNELQEKISDCSGQEVTNNPDEPGQHIWASVLELAEVWDELSQCVTRPKPHQGLTR